MSKAPVRSDHQIIINTPPLSFFTGRNRCPSCHPNSITITILLPLLPLL